MATTPAADIRKFTGFIAPDGTTHDTLKKATDYTKELKVKEALEAGFGNTFTMKLDAVSEADGYSNKVIFVPDLPKFLLDNRAAILAAFNQEVSMRKPRAANKVKKTSAAELKKPVAVVEAVASVMENATA